MIKNCYFITIDFENYIHIDTYGSFDAVSEKSGKGVHSLDKNCSFSSGLPDITQLYRAEVVENKAVCTVLENKWNRAILQKILATKCETHSDFASLATKKGKIEARKQETTV